MAKISKARRQELTDIDKIMSTPEGSRFMWRVLGMCGVFQSSFSADALHMAFREGQRNIGLKIQGDIIEACPGRFINLMNASQTKPAKEKEETNHVVDEAQETD